MKIEGIPVIDAEKPVYIHITDQDVKKGGVKKPGSCAAALACIRDLKATRALVYLGRIYLLKGSKWHRYMTPGAIRTELITFDRGGGFAAGDYTLSPPAPSNQLGYYKKTGPKKRKNRGRRPHHVVVGVRPHGPIGLQGI